MLFEKYFGLMVYIKIYWVLNFIMVKFDWKCFVCVLNFFLLLLLVIIVWYLLGIEVVVVIMLWFII